MNDCAYVSRGALKLKGLINMIGLDPKGKVVVDVGSSHGGFVQLMLLKGAKKVYAVDVGKGLLDWKLRNLKQVVVMEGVNAKDLENEQFDEPPQIGLVDVSFISLKKVLPILFGIATEKVIALVKPQFEAKYDEASKGKGVIYDKDIHTRVIEEIKKEVVNVDWNFIGTYMSEIKGKKGNQEYFIYYERV